jgi:hypothetical protein
MEMVAAALREISQSGPLKEKNDDCSSHLGELKIYKLSVTADPLEIEEPSEDS